MTYKSYYKIGSFLLILTSVSLAALIIAPFLSPTNNDVMASEEPQQSSEDEVIFEDELRMHRDLYLRIANSSNPIIGPELKDHCKDSVKEIDKALYESHITYEEEMELRKKLLSVNNTLKENIPGFVEEEKM